MEQKTSLDAIALKTQDLFFFPSTLTRKEREPNNPWSFGCVGEVNRRCEGIWRGIQG